MKIANYSFNLYNRDNSPSFEALKFKNFGKVKLFEDFPIKLKSSEGEKDCFVKASTDTARYYIDIVNDTDRLLGMSTSNNLKDKSVLYNNIIQNLHKDQNIQGVGSTMRLGQIIVLLENKKLNKIGLYSMGDAVYFHSKFKFKPAITDYSELAGKLEDILVHSNDNRFSQNVQEAKNFLELNKTKHKPNLKEGNAILDRYLQKVIANNLHKDIKFHIYSGFDMELAKKDILANKDFYNSLFQKYGIDYQIQ